MRRKACEVPSNIKQDVLESIYKDMPKDGGGKSGTCNYHCVFAAAYKFDKTSIRKGLIAASDHHIVFFKRGTSSFSHILTLSYLEIESMDIVHESKITISWTGKNNCHVLVIEGETDTVFWQVIWRDMMLNTMVLRRLARPKMTSDNESIYPVVNIDFSPAQRLQFVYAAQCSDASSYHHSAIQLINRKLAVSDYVLDLDTFSNTEQLMKAFPKTDLFSAVIGASSLSIPYLCDAITSGLHLRALSLVLEGCSLKPLAEALKRNPDCSIVAWRIRGHRISEKSLFMAAVAKSRAEMRVLDFSDMELTSGAAIALLNGIGGNKTMNKLEYLGLGGVNCTSKVKIALQTALVKLTRMGCRLQELHIGGNHRRAGKIACFLVNAHVDLEVADFSQNRRISDWAINQILQFVMRCNTVHEIDVSDTTFDSHYCSKLAELLATNGCEKLRTLRINDLGLRKRIAPVLSTILDINREVWGGLSLDGNRLDENITPLTVSVIAMLPNIRFVSLSNNFSSSMENIGEYIAKLMDVKSLKVLIIKGRGSRTLKHQAEPLIAALKRNTTLEKLDISGNMIGNKLYSELCGAFADHPTLKWLGADNSSVSDIERVKRMINIACEKPNVVGIKWPRVDLLSIIDKANSAKRESIINEVRQLRLKYELDIREHSAGLSEIHEVYDNLPSQMHEVIKEAAHERDASEVMQRRNIHTCAASLLHLPMPFQNENQEAHQADHIVHLIKKELLVFDAEALCNVSVEKAYVPLDNEYKVEESVDSDVSEESTESAETSIGKEDTQSADPDAYKGRRKLTYRFDKSQQPVRRAGESAKKLTKKDLKEKSESSHEAQQNEKRRLLELLQTMALPELEPRKLARFAEEESESDSTDSYTETTGTYGSSDSSDTEPNSRNIKRRRRTTDSSEDESSDEPSPPRKRKAHIRSSDDDIPRKKRRHVSDSEETPPKRRRLDTHSSDDDSPPRKRRSQIPSSDDEIPRKRRGRAQSSDEDSPPQMRKRQISSRDDEVQQKRRHETPRKWNRLDSSDDEILRSNKQTRSNRSISRKKRAHIPSSDEIPQRRHQNTDCDENQRKRRKLDRESSDEEKPEKRHVRVQSSDDEHPRSRQREDQRTRRRAKLATHSSDDEVPRRMRRATPDSDDSPSSDNEKPQRRRKKLSSDEEIDSITERRRQRSLNRR